ncbi:MAG: hypothetical protein Q9182_007614 [Xanthomendoza sp. 2 TL-2023]
MMAEKSLQRQFARIRIREDDAEHGTEDALTPAVTTPHSRLLELAPHNIRVRDYFTKNDATFRQLHELKEKGWNTLEGDIYFQRQRNAADSKGDDQESIFHSLHLKIGEEMRTFGAFLIDGANASRIKALNLCLAPGAYTAAILQQDSNASIRGITLPFESGGHKMIIPYGHEDPRVEVEFLDITMLIHEFVGETFRVPHGHPDASNFIPRNLFHDQVFDLILCDGQTLRVHPRAEYRETHEPRRLLAAQLVFGMTRIKPGGTFVILLHKAEAWDTMRLLASFNSFSQIALFKPKTAHRQRSTFYLVAKDVQAHSIEARQFIDDWKNAWVEATFGGEEGVGAGAAMPDESEVDALLQAFGSRLIQMARPIWSIQANALDHSEWLPGSAKSKTSRSWSLHSPASQEHAEPPKFHNPNSKWRMRSGSFGSSSQPSSAYSPRPKREHGLSSPLTSSGADQPRDLPHHELNEDKQKKMAGKWR